MKWNEPYTEEARVIVDSTTDIINLPYRYNPNQGELTVYVNGAAISKEFITESSPWSISFTESLQPQDEVLVRRFKF